MPQLFPDNPILHTFLQLVLHRAQTQDWGSAVNTEALLCLLVTCGEIFYSFVIVSEIDDFQLMLIPSLN